MCVYASVGMHPQVFEFLGAICGKADIFSCASFFEGGKKPSSRQCATYAGFFVAWNSSVCVLYCVLCMCVYSKCIGSALVCLLNNTSSGFYKALVGKWGEVRWWGTRKTGETGGGRERDQE